jgi:hypothetical protein
MLRRRIGGGLGLAAVVILAAQGCAAFHDLKPEEVAGCYQVKLTDWQPPMQLGGDLEFVSPPDRIELKLERSEHPWRKASHVVVPTPDSRETIFTSGEWTVSENEVQMLWTNGFSGLTMELSASKEGLRLRGTAHTFWDFPRPTQTAGVEATRVACPE